MLRLNPSRVKTRKLVSLSLSLFLYLCMLPTVPSVPAGARTLTPDGGPQDQNPQIVVIPPGSAYRQTNFISDIPGLAPVLDPLLVNPWGITATASSPASAKATIRPRSSACTRASRRPTRSIARPITAFPQRARGFPSFGCHTNLVKRRCVSVHTRGERIRNTAQQRLRLGA